MPTSTSLFVPLWLLAIGYGAAGSSALSFGGSKRYECQVVRDPSMRTPGVKNRNWLWPNGVVYWRYADNYNYTNEELKNITDGMRDVMYRTCITFFELFEPGQQNYIQLSHNQVDGCLSEIGMVGGGAQKLNLDPKGCITPDTVAHEIIHALGFGHEHQRTDRNDNVKIFWQNIEKGQRRNFDMDDQGYFKDIGPYEFESIMHYSNDAFGINGAWTLQAKRGDPNRELGNNVGLTRIDRLKICELYRCPITRDSCS